MRLHASELSLVNASIDLDLLKRSFVSPRAYRVSSRRCAIALLALLSCKNPADFDLFGANGESEAGYRFADNAGLIGRNWCLARWIKAKSAALEPRTVRIADDC